MRPRPWLLCFASFVALSGGLGCDLGPGEGFTTAEISAEVRWDMSGRLLDNGRLKTSKNYEIEVRRFDVNFGNVELETSARIAGDSFDPANPPEGYTLCHNGHCHNENDELIAYEPERPDVSSFRERFIQQLVSLTLSPLQGDHRGIYTDPEVRQAAEHFFDQHIAKDVASGSLLARPARYPELGTEQIAACTVDLGHGPST